MDEKLDATTYLHMAGVLFAIGLLSAGGAALSFIIWCLVLVGRICQVASRGWRSATDAITRYTVEGFPDMRTLRRVRSFRQRRRRTGLSMKAGLPRCEVRKACPTINPRYPIPT